MKRGLYIIDLIANIYLLLFSQLILIVFVPLEMKGGFERVTIICHRLQFILLFIQLSLYHLYLIFQSLLVFVHMLVQNFQLFDLIFKFSYFFLMRNFLKLIHCIAGYVAFSTATTSSATSVHRSVSTSTLFIHIVFLYWVFVFIG